MKKLMPLVVALLFSASQSFAIVCTNCSTIFIQALERITSLSQLDTLSNQYQEAITQTTQQLAMVQNMIQNTNQLTPNLRTTQASQLVQLASLTNKLRTQRGDITTLGQIYNNLYPKQSIFAGEEAATSPEAKAAANAQYQAYWDKWSGDVDQATEATFQLSGQQLADLQDSGGMQDYINQLVSTPEGQMQALQAGNQLAVVQIQEARQLRELMATTAQSNLASQEKAEKESQADKEWWRKETTTGGYDFSGCDKPLP